MKPELNLLFPTDWSDYELLDSGNGFKLERVGNYRLIRPATHAIWAPTLNKNNWDQVDAIYHSDKIDRNGNWSYKDGASLIPLTLGYKGLRFSTLFTSSRHIGFFPEQACQWVYLKERINDSGRQVRLLNLFGYTGIATLAAAQVGASVTHIDSSRKTIKHAQLNQNLSSLIEAPIRWICDDVYKFVQREIRRQSVYDAIIMDPPKFGRGPKGEVWDFFKLLPYLIESCFNLLSDQPLFFIITAYAIQAPALSLYYSLKPLYDKFHGSINSGELCIKEKSSDRLLSLAIYARWNI